jgi:hypothetical protein
MKRSRLFTRHKRDYVIVPHIDDHFGTRTLILTSDEYRRGHERSARWIIDKNKLDKVI